ncbi:hypothetical protein BD311DRAFT_764583 [Dichomitus squalens]|uniref:Uncharacterized protein n=1 Tax=Dichomitus squalens TaxID=114155 RepID=A0A4Q9MDQ1_9APHY|nr:hypothetical protein BD311DRAFT_764583 [Dichomitus squalens]
MAPSGPTTTGRRRCQALLVDEETPCAARVRRKGRYCDPHGVEYRDLTRGYKNASATVEALDRDILQTRMRVGALKDVTAVDEATAVANRYLEAIGEEIEGRRTHHKRFFQTSEWLVQ